MHRLNGKTALITGAASGIGRATAELFAEEGATVWVTDRDLAAAQRVAAAIGAHAAELDVTSEDHWQRALNGLPLDILIANAGISHASPLTATSLEDWRGVMAVNLDGVFLGVKHGLRAMAGRTGSIVIVSSASGLKAAPGAAAYCASKAALRLLAKCAALECIQAKESIRVNTVHPAGVVTPMWESMPVFPELAAERGAEEAWKAVGATATEGESSLKRFSTPREVARAILFLASDESPTITGTELVIDSGFTA
jgi:NAD(P)-dependent dehydrogenase (short-subunit alcohol dehydrogenase family)